MKIGGGACQIAHLKREAGTQSSRGGASQTIALRSLELRNDLPAAGRELFARSKLLL